MVFVTHPEYGLLINITTFQQRMYAVWTKVLREGAARQQYFAYNFPEVLEQLKKVSPKINFEMVETFKAQQEVNTFDDVIAAGVPARHLGANVQTVSGEVESRGETPNQLKVRNTEAYFVQCPGRHQGEAAKDCIFFSGGGTGREVFPIEDLVALVNRFQGDPKHIIPLCHGVPRRIQFFGITIKELDSVLRFFA